MEQFVGQIMPYFTVAIFLGGVTWRLWRWMIPRIMHNITLSPFPGTWTAAVTWWVWQIAIFWNILKFDRALWIGAFPFHAALIAIIAGHAMGIYTLGLQFHMIAPLLVSADLSVWLSDLLGTTMGLVFLVAVLYLLYRRFTVEKVRAISSTSDFLHLFLLLTIAGLGNYMRLVPDAHTTYLEARTFMAGLFTFNPVALPQNAFFMWHFFFVQCLMIIFPFSKLMHVFGFFWMRWMVNRPFKEWAPGMPGAKVQVTK
ncbi:MAG: respiratory nitrate reductase subunit gamma [Eubacteriales bacterium]|nr:respiratory nitrate reductase subunit gamma [Bacillota bacterium]MBV1727541.1 respiratory nitrate reductase subunit gamma [Desulforudis sp.]MDP3049762.1 respiratory nitrate reductase subunit gamma [Eubacteriales bacterium]MBU4534155.1 respiratory nitrate reductase subunit gamma [Bacillota bacterium]MBU4553401.1 respiratory nitrate reductase subunit gamma [Bacillota bacterium]